MQLSTTLLTFLSLALPGASAWSISDTQVAKNEQQVLGIGRQGLPVPGDNPMVFCQDPADYLLGISRVDVSPNPPQAGAKLNITATGVLQRQVDSGAYVKVQVKYGLIQLLSTTFDLCEQATEVDLKCPVEPGNIKIAKEVELPNTIPPGHYSVIANAYNQDDEQLTCLEAKVEFARHR